jgi:hypothetical protein
VHPKLKAIPGKRARFVRVAENLLLNTETGFYYARKEFKRLRIPPLFESTRETKIGRAKAKRDQMIADHLKRFHSEDGLRPRVQRTVAAVIDEFLEVETPTRRKGTQANHRDYLRELRKEWGRWPIDRITIEAWARWLVEFRRRKTGRKTFGDYASG